MHAEFLLQMLKACGTKNLHRTVDTCGFADSETMLEVAKRVITSYSIHYTKLYDTSVKKRRKN